MIEETFETEVMAEITPTLLARATGSTGVNPTQDSSARGLIAAALAGILVFIQREFDLISVDGADALVPVAMFLAFFLGGLYDKYIKGRVLSS